MDVMPIKLPIKEKLSVVAEKEIEKKQKFHGTIRPHKGHTLFQINLNTKEITEAQFEDMPYVISQKNNGKKKRVIMLPDCVYISALNPNNALKKLLKSINK